MYLIIRSDATHVVEFEQDESFATVKNRIAALLGLNPKEMHLYARGKPVEDAFLASDFEQDEIEMTIGLLGGKVHGSLARAGKVRAQTPKVEKQEKKKKKTGRAKKRAQYNKRFVSGVCVFGPKNGPNSNSCK